jgi:hypothetical protein
MWKFKSAVMNELRPYALCFVLRDSYADKLAFPDKTGNTV